MKPKDKTSQDIIPSRESALAVLANLRRQYGDKGSNLCGENEAKTRLLIIDKILESLGWCKEEFNPEHPVKHVGFTDYLITADGIPRFIVEAKRIGQTFIRPQTGLKKTIYQLSYIRTSFGPSVSEVINQAEGYAKETGVPYSVITNGAEWILLQAIPNRNKNINDLQCIYFGNLLSNVSHFDLFWDLLAKPCVVNNSLEEHFSEINSLPSDFCVIPSSKLPEINWSRSNDSDKYIGEFYDRFFGEIVDPGRRMMLKQCFVTNPKLDQYQGELKRTLQDTSPIYIPSATDISPDYDNPHFLPTESGDRKGRVVLITGSVGCGKSTFINKVLIEAHQRNTKKFNYLIIDLINEFDGTPEIINEYLWQEINGKWKNLRPEAYEHETLRKIFGRELQNLRKGSYAKVFEQDSQLLALKEAELLEKLSESPSEFLEKSWRYYASQNKKGVVVFLDNIDRTSDRYQRIVYTFAHKLASQTGATVIITMREGTYFRGREFGFLDVRSDDIVYHLQTPDLVQIISKRIEYVENLETPKEPSKKDHRLTRWRNQPNWQEFYKFSLKYTQVIKSTFLKASAANQSLNLLSAVSWHNVRYFLDILRDLHLTLGSETEVWSVSYIISALLSPNSISGGKSILPNLYYPVFPSYPCYFLKLRLLLRLLYGRHSSESRRGTTLKEILNFTRMYAYHERWTRITIRDMVRERLLECMEIPSEADFTKNYELEEFHSFRTSPLAVVMIKQVYFDNIYLSMIGRELPFHKSKAFEKFVDAVRDVITILSEESLNKTGVDLLSETEANSIVARYLVESFEEEKPIGDVLMHFPEVATTEEKLKDMIAKLLSIAGVSVPNRLPEVVSGFPIKTQELQVFQPSLFDYIDNLKLIQETNSIQVPHELANIQTTTRSLAPKIFWAMVELRARGKKQVTGSEIANIINQYLVDDINKVEPTNISKALRGRALQSQSWLNTEQIASRKKLYGLSDNWRGYWEQTFNEQSPTLD
ncbi:MAG: P-loop NTPase fold protein [Nostoc sp.]|uniref:P-loop NTPase fold protein n=1 Tax=Nostoc sp. TaxID=1180 RepID=UPI002FF7CED8